VAESLSNRIFALIAGKKSFRTFYLRRPNDQGQLCLACHDRSLLASDGFHVREASLLDQYAGSATYETCHARKFREWERTSHARMARDPKRDPAALTADFSVSPPFPADEVLYVLGNHWTQRFVVAKGDKLYVKAPIWSIPQAQWDTSYWIDKPWTQYCQGCHTTGFEMKEKPAFAELGIGCEACHGPAGAHVESAGRVPVINPADLDPVRSDMICQSCHTTGHDRTGQFRFPLGYLPGKDLTRFYKGLLPKPGQDNESFAGDESYEDRHRQWLFWVGSFMDVKGMTCDICKNFRSRLDSKEKVQMTPSEYCLSCHRDDWPGDSLHQDHLQDGVHCHRCHVPEVAPGGKRFSIHDHKFLFLEPEVAEAVPPREACGHCHPDGAPLERDKP
jgi:hypothetical protein